MPTLVERDKNNKPMEPTNTVLGRSAYLSKIFITHLACNCLDRRRPHIHSTENHGLNLSIMRLIHY